MTTRRTLTKRPPGGSRPRARRAVVSLPDPAGTPVAASGRVDWAPLAQVLRKGSRFVLTGHAFPDGDVLGSELALARHLRSTGKDARCINCGIVPQNYRWMFREGEIVEYAAARDDAFIRGADAVLVFDYGNLKRLEEMTQPIRAGGALLVGIDHHPREGERPAMDIVDLGSAAVGEMIYDLIHVLGGTITREIADPLYVSLTTDTGSFRYSNTSSRSHRIAAHLVAAGVESYEVYRHIYEASSERRLRMMAEALRGLATDAGGRIAWISVTRAMLDEFGLTEDETEGFIDVVRTLKDAQIAILMKEVRPGRVKVSLRSRGAADVAAVARRFGGGGHVRAAGMTLQEPLEAARERVLEAAREALRASP